jgi:hypothetical protein
MPDAESVKHLLLIAFALLVVGCHHRKPAMSDEDMKLVRAEYPGMSEDCLDKIRRGGPTALPIATDECFKMTDQRQWSGLWVNGFEYSDFCPAPASGCPDRNSGELIWLSASRSIHLSSYEGQSAAPMYEVKFIGRMTSNRGHFGHAGLFDREIIVDRLISIRSVEQGK